MDRLYKRPRLEPPPSSPEFDLLYRREKNDRRLKSTFEAIFEKYGRDFEGVGDEIDLETGEIVVNNGHVVGMVNERDAGGGDDDERDGSDVYDDELDAGDVYDDEEEEEGGGGEERLGWESEIEEWEDEVEGGKLLAESLLLETGRRFGALERAEMLRQVELVDDELASGDDEDSLMGDEDSLVGDSEPEPSLPPIRGRSISLDDLDEDGGGDVLGMEWPTPRKQLTTPVQTRPTPKMITPLSHMSWHTSPAKRAQNKLPPADPMWSAPPLPGDRHPRKDDLQTTVLQRQRGDEFDMDAQIRGLSPRSQDRRIKALPIKGSSLSPRNPSRLSNSQVSQGASNTENRSNCSKPISRPRWSKADDSLLVQLKTRTELKFADMAPYFPGRGIVNITRRWSDMTRNAKYRSENSPRGRETAVISKDARSPTLYETIESDVDDDPSTYEISKGTPYLRTHLVNNSDARRSVSYSLYPSSSLPSKAEKSPKHRKLIKLSGNSPRTLQRSNSWSSYSLYTPGILPFSNPDWTPERRKPKTHAGKSPLTLRGSNSSNRHNRDQPVFPARAHRDASTPMVAKEDEDSSQLPTSPRAYIEASAMTSHPAPVSKLPWPSSQPEIHRMSEPGRRSFVGSSHERLARNTPRESLSTNEGSRSRQQSSSAPKRAVFLPSDLSNDSDDELSTAVKTIGADKGKARQVSTAELSSMVHEQLASALQR